MLGRINFYKIQIPVSYMSIFGIGKRRGEVLDLSEKYHRDKERASEIKSEMTNPSKAYPKRNSSNSVSDGGVGNFFGDMASISSQTSESDNQNVYIGANSDDPEERRRKLAKRLADMTDKIEDLTNQVYHLQQRVEVLEKKSRNGDYDEQ
jgi:chromosome segregation ATPase